MTLQTPSQPPYKSRVRLVRGAALDHLRQLRQDRLAKRLPRVVPAAGAALPAPEPQDIAISRHTAELLANCGLPDVTEPSVQGLISDQDPPVTVTDAPNISAEPEDVADQPDPDPLIVTSQTADMAQQPLEGAAPLSEAVAVADNADGAQAEIDSDSRSLLREAAEIQSPVNHQGTALTPEPDVASNLNLLPGAGTGLVWLMQQCGVHSLEDLAAADPVRLSGKLGLVGTLLDLADWIDFARNNGNTDPLPRKPKPAKKPRKAAAPLTEDGSC